MIREICSCVFLFFFPSTAVVGARLECSAETEKYHQGRRAATQARLADEIRFFFFVADRLWHQAVGF